MCDSPFRFGISRLPTTAPELRRCVAGYEAEGFDFVAIGDHVAGGESPFAMLAAAATACQRLRLRTYVINTGLWNASLLAREAATVDRLSEGRLELGFGAGNDRSEFDLVGSQWRSADERVQQMKQTLLAVGTQLDDLGSPQRPVPILVGAMSRSGLAVAAEHADIIAFSGLRHRTGYPPGTLRGATAAETDELVKLVRNTASSRPYESDILLQTVGLGKDPMAAARAWLEEDPDELTPAELVEAPSALFAKTAADAAVELQRRRERWGFTSVTTFAHSSQALAAVMRELR